MTPDAHTYREQCYLKGPIGAFRITYLGQAVLRACEKTRPHRATPLGEKPTFSFQSPEVASTAENAPCSAQPNARRDAGRQHVQLRAARVVDEARITASKRRSVNAPSCAPPELARSIEHARIPADPKSERARADRLDQHESPGGRSGCLDLASSREARGCCRDGEGTVDRVTADPLAKWTVHGLRSPGRWSEVRAPPVRLGRPRSAQPCAQIGDRSRLLRNGASGPALCPHRIAVRACRRTEQRLLWTIRVARAPL